jgi:hypothetical protein
MNRNIAYSGTRCCYRLLDRRRRFAAPAPNDDIDCSLIMGDHVIVATEQPSNDVRQRARIDAADVAVQRNRRMVS